MKKIKAVLSSICAKPAILSLSLNLIYHGLFIVTPLYLLEHGSDVRNTLLILGLFIFLIGYPIVAGVCGFVMQLRYIQQHRILISAGIFTAISVLFSIGFFGLQVTSFNAILEFAAKQAIAYIVGGGIVKLPVKLYHFVLSRKNLQQHKSQQEH